MCYSPLMGACSRKLGEGNEIENLLDMSSKVPLYTRLIGSIHVARAEVCDVSIESSV